MNHTQWAGSRGNWVIIVLHKCHQMILKSMYRDSRTRFTMQSEFSGLSWIPEIAIVMICTGLHDRVLERNAENPIETEVVLLHIQVSLRQPQETQNLLQWSHGKKNIESTNNDAEQDIAVCRDSLGGKLSMHTKPCSHAPFAASPPQGSFPRLAALASVSSGANDTLGRCLHPRCQHIGPGFSKRVYARRFAFTNSGKWEAGKNTIQSNRRSTPPRHGMFSDLTKYSCRG